MNRLIALVILVSAGSILAGCAGYTIEENGTGDGFDVFRPEPYLLVTTVKEANNNYTKEAKIIWLPNYSKRYRVSTCNFLAKSDISFTIDEGWKLTAISDKSDNTTVATKLVELLPELLPADAERRSVDSSSVTLYRLVFDSTSGVLTSVKKVPDLDSIN